MLKTKIGFIPSNCASRSRQYLWTQAATGTFYAWMRAPTKVEAKPSVLFHIDIRKLNCFCLYQPAAV